MQASDKSNLEGRLSLAIQAYKSSRVKSLCKAASQYNIPYVSLNTRFHGIPPRRDSRPVLCKLISIKEQVLTRCILDFDA